MNLPILMDELKALRNMDHDSPYISHFLEEATFLMHKQVCSKSKSRLDGRRTVPVNIIVQVKIA